MHLSAAIQGGDPGDMRGNSGAGIGDSGSWNLGTNIMEKTLHMRSIIFPQNSFWLSSTNLLRTWREKKAPK